VAKRKVIETRDFSSKIKELLKTHRLNWQSYENFMGVLSENPEMGVIIPGTGGVRKTRLASASKGKRGGFRVCYYFHDVDTGAIYLIDLYSKNEKIDLTPNEKQKLKGFAKTITRV
jgi:mRNA-degrading endonuclease RelE of RelBE toxin-antitoxin system